MNTEYFEIKELEEFREALAKLVEDRKSFQEVAKAVEERDAERFQAVLSRLGIYKYCQWICRWYCVKVRGFVCILLCPQRRRPTKPTVDEMLQFGEATVRLAANKEAFKALLDAYNRQDAKTFRSILAEWEMMPYCMQFCRWFAHFDCRLICKLFCPPMPVITHVGNIPTSQIDAEGYANGPSQPPGKTEVPDVTYPTARGDHPFGGLAEVRGILNIANPDKYKVEYSQDLATWTPIMRCVEEWNGFINITRCPSPAPDPGWYNVAEMVNVNYLTDWKTPPEQVNIISG